MKSRKIESLLFLLATYLLCLNAASGSPKVVPELLGTWDYTTMTNLKDGKPFGTVHFQPGQWTVTFNQDATWTMKPPPLGPKPGSLNGKYSVHGKDVEMKLSNGNPYDKYRFAVGPDGKLLTVTDKNSIITASRE